MKNKLLFILLILSTFVSCAKKEIKISEGTSIDGKIDSTDLSSRLISVNQALSVVDSNGDYPLVFSSNMLDFEHMATVKAPKVSSSDSRRLRATSLVKSDNTIFISYMMEGSDFIGSLDIVNVQGTPSILSSYKFTNVKISDVKIKGNVAYLVGSKKNQGATLLIMDISNLAAPKFIKYFVFPGDMATSLDIRQNQLLISSAKNGGIIQFDLENPLSPKYLGFEYRENALYVKAMLTSEDAYSISPMVLQGSGKTLIEHKGYELPVSSLESEAPSRFSVMGPMLYVASAGGLTISEISDKFNGFVRHVPLDGKANGVAHLDQKLYVAAGDKGLKYFNVEEPGSPVELGYFDFEDLGSANNVWVERLSSTQKLIALADGQSGVRLIKEEKQTNSSSIVVKVHAKSTEYLGEKAKIAVYVNDIEVGTAQEISSTNFDSYIFEDQSRSLQFGDKVKVVYFNDDGPRNVSVAYVKVGEDFFYPWVNNYYYFNNNLVYANDSDNLIMEEGGYYKFTF